MSDDGPEEVYDDVESAMQGVHAVAGVTTTESTLDDGPTEIYDDVQNTSDISAGPPPPFRPPPVPHSEGEVGPPSFKPPPIPPMGSSEPTDMYTPHPDVLDGPEENYEPFQDTNNGDLEDYEMPEIAAEKAKAYQQQQQNGSAPPLPPDNRKLSKTELKEQKKEKERLERLDKEKKRKEEARLKAKRKNLSAKTFKVFGLQAEDSPKYETTTTGSNARGKDGMLIFQSGETVSILLMRHEKLPAGCYVAEKDDGAVGFINKDNLAGAGVRFR
jgi:hypothetical protein